MIRPIGITEVLEARIASGRTARSTSAKICCLSARSSGAASMTQSASATQANRRWAPHVSTALSSKIVEIRKDARPRFRARRHRVVDPDVVAGEAKTCAMPWPIRPPPRIAMRSGHSLSCRVAAVGVKDVTGVEVRRLGREEQQRPCEILWLAEPALWHAGEEAGARSAPVRCPRTSRRSAASGTRSARSH